MGMKSEKQSFHKRNSWLQVHSIVWLVLLAIIFLKNDVKGDLTFIPETSCTKELLISRDNFTVERIINATPSDIASYPIVSFATSKSATSGFTTECTLDLRQCSSLPPLLPYGCSCMTTVPDIYKITMNKSASDIFSNVFIKVTWKTDEMRQLPFMYDECDAAALKNPILTSNGSCTFGVETDRLVEYCCHTIRPCNASIEYRNKTSTPVFGTPCAQLILPDGSEYETLTFSHTVCGRSCNSPFTCSPVIPVVECSCSCQVVVIVIGVVTGVGICAVAAYVLYLQMSKGASGKDKKHGSTTSQKVL